MIDLGLSKLALIGVVALVVIGPEKLPRVARMAGTLYGRAQRYINQVKSEVGREMELDALRKMQKDMQDAASDIGKDLSECVGEAQSAIYGALSSAQHDYNGSDDNPLLNTPTPDQLAIKQKNFRKKKLARMSAVPVWFKHQSGRKTRVISGAARVSRFRPTGSPGAGSFH
ncbi:sec-independent protein translocase protein TatB [Actimicrobium sp. GrIS 1.19]|uniref:Sec-independent protein translocase protein TatB n=1 Tax=Actimicrobium sp. GrIS 1.19 TaxID=3071708 RepID=UPI002E051FA8|nr:sec-independent protein translocase protein TatB [Actimicrobium sp. GrIS 1.19]